MRIIGAHDINTLHVMDGVDIKGQIYKAKELVSSPCTEEDLAAAWKVVNDAIERRITHEKQRSGNIT